MKILLNLPQRRSFILAFLLCTGVAMFMAGMASAQQPKTSVTLGIKPDYWSTKGVKVKGILKGTAAERAGLKEKDVIVAFDGKEIKNIFTYRDLLSEYKPGDKVVVKIKRNGKLLLLPAQFE